MRDIQSLFAALADPTRRSLFERLSTDGPASASQLAEELPITRQAIAKHITMLEGAGLVSRQDAGREIQFAADPTRLDELGSWSSRVNQHWRTRLNRLSDLG